MSWMLWAACGWVVGSPIAALLIGRYLRRMAKAQTR